MSSGSRDNRAYAIIWSKLYGISLPLRHKPIFYGRAKLVERAGLTVSLLSFVGFSVPRNRKLCTYSSWHSHESSFRWWLSYSEPLGNLNSFDDKRVVGQYFIRPYNIVNIDFFSTFFYYYQSNKGIMGKDVRKNFPLNAEEVERNDWISFWKH